MPRKRPTALRRERWAPARFPPFRRIAGVSSLTRAAIRRVEDECYWPNAVWSSLEQYKLLLRQPGRYLNGDESSSPGIEAEDGRDLIASVLTRLPRGARRDLERLIAPLDKDFVRRTVPRLSWTDWAAGRWWYQRDREL
ncbi:hypothetical protein GCM10018962_14330 [Dactylosporangium matsuzakiense]|uniref:Uncharacterized protein n=1 Tax=Dactylosporangium matsuzakiense TaxID=53360 RepID=A0A9W6KWK4_9ACTN|nr:hypothetical protein GCM10017581_104100 [Dactylosporangium matsuzakiense]